MTFVASLPKAILYAWLSVSWDIHPSNSAAILWGSTCCLWWCVGGPAISWHESPDACVNYLQISSVPQLPVDSVGSNLLPPSPAKTTDLRSKWMLVLKAKHFGVVCFTIVTGTQSNFNETRQNGQMLGFPLQRYPMAWWWVLMKEILGGKR